MRLLRGDWLGNLAAFEFVYLHELRCLDFHHQCSSLLVCLGCVGSGKDLQLMLLQSLEMGLLV